MLERTTISQPDRPPGILEHLSEGMSLVLAFPQLIAIPVLLDIYLLIGARISPAAMTTRLGDWLVGRNGANSSRRRRVGPRTWRLGHVAIAGISDAERHGRHEAGCYLSAV